MVGNEKGHVVLTWPEVTGARIGALEWRSWTLERRS